MLKTDIKACPVFTRWQIRCNECGVIFYVDVEPETPKEDIMGLDELQCGEHPTEDHCLELA